MSMTHASDPIRSRAEKKLRKLQKQKGLDDREYNKRMAEIMADTRGKKNKLRIGDTVLIQQSLIDWHVNNSGFYRVANVENHTPEALAELGIWIYAWKTKRPLIAKVIGFGSSDYGPDERHPDPELMCVRIRFKNAMGEDQTYTSERHLKLLKRPKKRR